LQVLLLCVAVVTLGLGIHYATAVQPGWNEVQALCDEPNYSSEFCLVYDFSQTGDDAAAVNKALIQLYSEIMEEGYRIFSKDARLEGVLNLSYLNRHVNEVVTVEEPLYQALEQIQTYENRCIFLAPVYVEYNRVFNSESEPEAMNYDPEQNPEIMDYISQLIRFVGNNEEISLELLGQNQVKLNVSEAYLEFAAEHGIEEFLDFGWMRNAFVADMLADAMQMAGFTSGYLASFDGFTRNLDSRPISYAISLFDRQDGYVYHPAEMSYQGPVSIVSLREYPMINQDRWNCYVYENGETVSTHIDPATGRNETAAENLLCYSREFGCAEVLMQMMPCYFAQELLPEAFRDLKAQGTNTVWFSDFVLHYNDSQIQFQMKPDTEGNFYTQHFSE